ncbi:DUF4352 domain-containing protein [Actinoplanes sp. LDG1-06]|uniref:DUF4352 domain-containing protein n=1 Tax=Paractinoplanes ovalisporus TaxID=2810368 RepID=A0ABS2AHP2_9ACTN|nr:DUF4352 domain-containing protein [Actinoplanes ovalisporus]MBM2619295.1 DUF4352 domain-containing protein [Actinoplanes ovalisporus]
MTDPAPAEAVDEDEFDDENAGPPRPLWPWVAGVLVLAVVAALSWFFVLRDENGGREVLSTAGGEINKPVRDGKFVFTVTAVRCGVAKVGDEFVNLEPKGSYCLIDLLVKNGAKTAEYLDSTSQKAYDASGAEFATDMQAEVFVNGQPKGLLDEIAGGAQVKGTLVFDVPPETALASVVLHDAFSSPGARIALK